jgi:ABC-type polysaccharide/polyol phosphate export permease
METSTPVEKPSGGRSLLTDIRHSLRRPEFWTFAAWLDLITKYRRSRLGVLWMFVPPTATILVLGYFYSGLTGRDPFVFMPYMGLGYALWRLIAQVINESTGVMLAHRAFIMDGRTRFTDYVLRCISKAGLSCLAALIVVLAALLISPAYGLGGLPTLVVTVPIFMVNLFSVGMVLSLLGARFPDTQEMTHTVFIFGFMLTPILWYPENLAPGGVRWMLVQANPAYHLIEFVRGPVLGRPLDVFTIAFVAATTTILPLLAAALYRRYARYVPIWI